MSKKPKPRYVTPSLESITVRGKYKIPETDFSVVRETVSKELNTWLVAREFGESVEILHKGVSPPAKLDDEWWRKHVTDDVRAGVPVYFSILTLEHFNDSMLVEVETRPAMWYLISQGVEVCFTENQVQEALLDCRGFARRVMGIFRGREVEPVSVYPIIQRTEIKSRLLNLGLKKVVSPLDKAEEHIVQNNFKESLKSSRTAFEKMIDWQMKKRGLEQTNNYKNNLERLRSKGYLDKETTKLLQTYYRCLSNIGVHERGIEPGIFEAQMGYGITLIMLQYFANKLP